MSMMWAMVLYWFTKFEVCRPSRSEDMVRYPSQH